MADLDRIKRNVGKMVSMNAPEADIDAYIAEEGVSLDAVRAHKLAPSKQYDLAPKTADETKFKGGALGAAALGAMDAGSFSFGDELGATLGAASEYLGSKITGAPARSRVELLAAMRDQDKRAQESNPGSYLAGQIGGGVATGGGLAAGGLSLGANAARAGAGLARTAGMSAVDGALLGGLSGVGSGENVQSRIAGGAAGIGLGAVAGGAAPVVAAGVGAVSRPLIAPVMSRLRSQEYANDALAETLRRSGRTIDDVSNELRAAQADGQGVYNVADALGNEGQRRLSTIVRTPNEARNMAVDALEDRQIAQGERLSAALADGFNAPRTARQTSDALGAARTAEADINYEAARQNARPVDVSAAVRSADNLLFPGASRLANPADNIADDTVERAVRKARARITDGRSNLSDYDSVFRARQDLQDDIQAAVQAGRGNQARLLGRMDRELDAALERASPAYRNANDTFRQRSQVIDAIDTGADATRSARRAGDTIDEFRALNPEQQQSFRTGYADRLISKTEAAAVSPSTNKARPLMTGKTAQEMPEFAAPGQGEQLANRIGREQRMFESYNAARMGSRTADNMADQSATGAFDPSILLNVVKSPLHAATTALVTVLRQTQGLPEPVMQRIAATLLDTRPDVARRMLGEAMQRRAQNTNVRALGNAILTTMSASAAGRLSAP